MKYMLLMYWADSDLPKTPEELEAVGPAAWQELAKEMNEAGAYVATNGLDAISNATTVRVRNGKTLTTDGPFAETHEHLGGYYLIDCKDLDEAIRWAGKIPASKYGSIEIRQLWGQKQ